MNTVVARGDLSSDPGLRRPHRPRPAWPAPADQAHEDLPFERLVKELAPERDLAHTPIVQVMFAVYDSSTGSPPDLGGLKVSPVDLRLRRRQVRPDDLAYVTPRPDGSVEGVLEYATALFDEVR